MAWRNTREGWGSVSQGLHWLTAALVFALILLGIIGADMGFSKAKIEVFQWHKSLGLAVLAVALVRIGWRLANPSPAHPPDSPRLQNLAATTVHVLIYALLLAMPLAGWVINAAGDVPFKPFGLFALPDIVAKSDATKELFETIHRTMAYTLMTLLALHIGAALHHHLIRRNDTLRRMLPRGGRR